MEPVVPEVGFGTVEEILHPTPRILITEHPFHLNLLRSPAASSVVKEEEMGSPTTTSAVSEEEMGSPAAISVVSEKEMGSPAATSVVREEEMANMTKGGRDLIRNEIWREKVNIIQLQYLSI